ncbi:hypothetical protein ACJIZ3_002194 [Penstemon smallii]|uniref:Uncharacterized protein n=1 Tax=Penstemon smallii TaxID=265156 RepID=A0ABD3U5U8_9LAMI
MLPLKLVNFLVSGDNIIANNPLYLSQNHHFFHHEDNNPKINTISTQSRHKIPLMLFIPTQELVKDTYRLATIARAMGMDLHPNPSLSHIIFSWPPKSQSSSASCTWSFPNDSVPLPFPSFSTASLFHLRLFVTLSKGYFKLAFLQNNGSPLEKIESLSNNNRHCSSFSLYFTRTGEKIESMDGFSKALLGMGWTLFKNNCSNKDTRKSLESEVYLYRKLDVSKICNDKQQVVPVGNVDFGECSRVKELRLVRLDFENVPLRILQYVLLMTDDIFYLA